MGLGKIIQIVLGLVSLVVVSISIMLDQTFTLLLMIIAVDVLAIAIIVNAFVSDSGSVQIPPQPQQPFQRPMQQPPRPQMPVQPGIVKEVDIPPEPRPEPLQPSAFQCKHCGKLMDTEKKLRRHIGMAHIDKLEI